MTSPTGAVIRDILHRLADRFPRRVLVWPVLVQGEGAAEQVAAAIDGFNALPPGGPVPRPDVLIVARGGGSIEDLWAFNEEAVVRAAAACTIPLISAVGHETDTTLIDHAADRRAPTPTAAAEMAVPVRRDLLLQLGELDDRLDHAMAEPAGPARRSGSTASRAACPAGDAARAWRPSAWTTWASGCALRSPVELVRLRLSGWRRGQARLAELVRDALRAVAADLAGQAGRLVPELIAAPPATCAASPGA